MKLSLSLKLGIGVVLLFAAVIATCLLWAPVKVRHYVGKLNSDDPKERLKGVEGLLGMGEKGVAVLAVELAGGEKEAEFIAKNWKYWNSPLPDDEISTYAIHRAVEMGYTHTVRLLLDKGTKVNVKDKWGQTPLHWAAYKGRKEIAEILIRKCANVDDRDNSGRTPLHAVTQNDHIDIALLLIEKCADVNVANEDYFTPLHWAVLNSNKDIAEILIVNGANVNAKARLGQTPLDLAIIEKKEEDIAALLRAHGAKTGEELINESSVKRQGSSVEEEEKK